MELEDERLEQHIGTNVRGRAPHIGGQLWGQKSSSPTEDGGVRAEDNGVRGRSKKTLEEAKSTRGHADDSANTGVSIRADRLPSLRQSNYDGDLYPQEFDHEEVVVTVEEDPRREGLRRRTPPVDTSAQQQLNLPLQHSRDEPIEELGRLAAELNRQLELQRQKSEVQGSGPTGGFYEPEVVRPASGSGPTSGSYEPQVVRPTTEQEVRGWVDSIPFDQSNGVGHKSFDQHWSKTSRITLMEMPIALIPIEHRMLNQM